MRWPNHFICYCLIWCRTAVLLLQYLWSHHFWCCLSLTVLSLSSGTSFHKWLSLLDFMWELTRFGVNKVCLGVHWNLWVLYKSSNLLADCICFLTSCLYLSVQSPVFCNKAALVFWTPLFASSDFRQYWYPAFLDFCQLSLPRPWCALCNLYIVCLADLYDFGFQTCNCSALPGHRQTAVHSFPPGLDYPLWWFNPCR